MVLTSKSELFFFIIYSSYLLLISSFSSPYSLSSQSIDTCIQTRRASAILLVKLDLCWTHMVQHTFEMMGSHLFLVLFLSFSSLFLFFKYLSSFLFFRFSSLTLSLSLSFVLHPVISLNLIHLLPIPPLFRTL